jgi:DNA repair ATPase RecN
MGRIDPQVGAKAETCAEIAYRVDDLVEELRAYLKSVEFNDRRQEEVEEAGCAEPAQPWRILRPC